MKKRWLLSNGIFAVLTLLCSTSTLAQLPTRISPAESGEFVSIFDGKTLDGWEAFPKGTESVWEVKDGMIVGGGAKGRSELVYTKNKEIADLELTFRYRFPGTGNSGVSIRAVPDPTGKREFQCYHADIGHVGIGKEVLGAWDFHTPGRTEHRCFLGDKLVIDEHDEPHITAIEGGLTEADVKQDDWNEVRVIAEGNHFRFYINGKLASEFIENLDPQKRLHSGMIQLQVHDPGMVVHFKDLQLKVLKNGK